MAEPVKKLPLYISQISVLITTNDLGCQPAQQQPPQLQDPCRPHRRSLLRRLLQRYHHDLLRAQAGHQHQHVQPQTKRREGREFDFSIKQVLLIWPRKKSLIDLPAAPGEVWQRSRNHR